MICSTHFLAHTYKLFDLSYQTLLVIMEEIYTALADAMNIDDITSSKDNQDILRRLKENDTTLNSNSMRIISDINSSFGDINYLPTDGEDLEWLGIYLGGNSTLHELDIAFLKALPKQFYKGLDRNRSIRKH